MPGAADEEVLLLDTSAAVPLVLPGHEARDLLVRARRGRTLGLAGHAAFETFSVLTRLPGTMRRPPSVVADILAHNFPATIHLSAARSAHLLSTLGTHEIGGGAVCDALVGAAAVEHGLPLATRDRRALDTYRALGVEVELL